jgi:hypothetical protein
MAAFVRELWEVPCLCLGVEGVCKAGGAWGNPESHLLRAWDTWGKAASIPYRLTKLSVGCSGSCCHGDASQLL